VVVRGVRIGPIGVTDTHTRGWMDG